MLVTITINSNGTVRFWNEKGEPHRIGGPAVEYHHYTNYRKEWIVNGKFHRLDGPAVEYPDGHKEWWIKDELHRLDGPAVEYEDGRKAWWINSVEYTEEVFNKIVGKLC